MLLHLDSIQRIYVHWWCVFVLRNCSQLFRSMAYRARKREDLLRALDDFFSGAFVIPPGQWDPAIRLEPPQHVQSRVRRTTSAAQNLLHYLPG